jgi:hypothetical protein
MAIVLDEGNGGGCNPDGSGRWRRLLSTAAVLIGEIVPGAARSAPRSLVTSVGGAFECVQNYVHASSEQVIPTVKVTHCCQVSAPCHGTAPYLVNAMRPTLLRGIAYP